MRRVVPSSSPLRPAAHPASMTCVLEEAGHVCVESDPVACFEEDPLHMLRVVRMSVSSGLEVEDATQRALRSKAPLLAKVAPERIGQEINAIIACGKMGTALLSQPEVMCAAMPELAQSYGFDQRSVYHVYDVYEHIAHVCCACEAFCAGNTPLTLRWAALMHDIGKPATYSEDVAGHGHFFAHPQQSAAMARSIMGRMGMPNELVEDVCALVRLHDERMPATRQAVRRLLVLLAHMRPGREVPLAYQLFDLRRADAVSKCADAASWAHRIDDYTRILREEIAVGFATSVSQLAVNEDDVMRELGVSARAATLHLDALFQAHLYGAVPNRRDELIAWLRTHS